MPPTPFARRAFLTTTAGALLTPVLYGCRGAGRSSTRPDAALGVALEEQMPAWMRAGRLPGASLVLIRDGAIAWSRGFGVMQAGTQKTVTSDSIFEAASMSKPVFAYAVLSLHDQGILDLDTPLVRYFPDGLATTDTRARDITARHVLSHTSGLPTWRSGDLPFVLGAAPGERWLYSGEGYFYLQSVVSHLTGRTNPELCARYEGGFEVCATNIDTWLKNRVLMPFRMASGTYVWTDALAPHVATPHAADGTALPAKHPTATDAARYAAAGGLLCTADDYARFLCEVVAPSSSGPFHLTPATLETMMRPVVKVSEQPFLSSWALGWQILHTAAGSVVAHGGDNTGFHSFAAASPSRRSGFVVMTNGEGGVHVIQQLGTPDMLRRLITEDVA